MVVKGDESLIKDFEAAKTYLKQSDFGKKFIDKVESSKNVHILILTKNGKSATNMKNGVMIWNPQHAKVTSDGKIISPAIGLVHELGHSVQAMSPESSIYKEVINSEKNPVEHAKWRHQTEQLHGKQEEDITKNIEHKVINDLNKKGIKEGKRSVYGAATDAEVKGGPGRDSIRSINPGILYKIKSFLKNGFTPMKEIDGVKVD
ncbi:hypothetical protein CH371_15585 [Leptospira wolffii]|uniref:Uncharacterized protein n=1 Tax=Leptospira wolffii TaxID=409998 RepID=A0A2M9Z9A3_9LEPT|nr:hypothetical protein [Leptospira wolffii]PJZ64922.1 hypothetical protein CH371_15585 [Leptospira wolffii]